MNTYNRTRMVSSPNNTPFVFNVEIGSSERSSPSSYSFQIEGVRPGSAELETHHYQIEGRDHNSYLDFFQNISHHFHLRIPHNRRRNSGETSFSAQYRVVLTENLHPDMNYGYGDPAILKVDHQGEETYYLVCTSNDAANSFPIIKSKDLKNWEFCSFIFPEGAKPGWTAEGESIADYWAPEMHLVGEEFRVYFVARDKFTRELCLGMARAASPQGPFMAWPEPIIKENVIDPHLFVEDDHHVYLFWKEDNNDIWPQKLTEVLFNNPQLIPNLFPDPTDQRTASLVITLWPWAKKLEAMERFFVLQILIEAVIERFTEFEYQLRTILHEHPRLAEAIEEVLLFMRTPMFVQRLASDGVTLIGERIKILENDMQWEAHLVEGMWVTRHQNKYYLFYAGNDFSTDQYGIGVAISDQVTGPYVKSEKQLLQTSIDWIAPGHPSVLVTNDGRHLMFLHAYSPGSAGYKKFRALLEIGLNLSPDGVTILQS